MSDLSCEDREPDNSDSELKPRTFRLQGQRGRQKHPTKVLITLRLSPQVLAFFKEAGKGWQTRVNDVLCAYVNTKKAEHVDNEKDINDS